MSTEMGKKETTTIEYSPGYFKDGDGYLSYSVNLDDGEVGYSGMGWKEKAVDKLAGIIGSERFAALMSGEKVEVEPDVMSKIHSAWHKTKYKKYEDVYVGVDVDPKMAEIVYRAYKEQSQLSVEYNEGWAMYPSDEEEDEGACVSDNGLMHVIKVGKSTGTKPVLLHLATERSHGGGEFMFAGIKSLQILGEPKVVFKSAEAAIKADLGEEIFADSPDQDTDKTGIRP